METTVDAGARHTAPRFDLEESLGALFLRRLLRTPRGRAFMVSFMAHAEEADEKGVFDTLVARVEDPELAKLVRVHRDDEVRHAEMLRGCLTRIGAAEEPMPQELRVVDRIDRHTGRNADAFVAGKAGVMEAYLVLQVIEERGVSQFPKIANAMRAFDPESAAVIDRITKDEERHVRYAKAISRRYASSDGALADGLARFRRGEAIAFAEHSRAFLAYATKHGILGVSGAERVFWRIVAGLGLPTLRPTPCSRGSTSEPDKTKDKLGDASSEPDKTKDKLGDESSEPDKT